MTKTVAIIGRGKTRKYLEHRAGVDYWAFNDNAMTVPYLTGMFEMHCDWETTERYNVIGCEGYRDWLKEPHPFPIWMHETSPLIPASFRYPLEAMPRMFFTSTTPYALALAIYLGYRRIEMYGIEADKGYEYDFAREAIFYWMGRAEGAGTEIILHAENKLFDAPLYWQRIKK